MKEKGDHFIQSLALALATLALLLFVLSRLIAPAIFVVPKADLVEVQLAGTGGLEGGGASAGGTPGGGTAAAQRMPGRQIPPRPPPAPAKPVPVPAPPAPALPLPAPASTPITSPSLADAETRTMPPEDTTLSGSPAGAGAGGSRTGEPGAGSPGTGAGAGGAGAGAANGAGNGTGDFSAGLPPATIADIDPVPLRSISASYPISARRLGQQGLVKVRADVDADGRVTGCVVAASSGFASLDNAALDAVRNARFMPAMKNGRPVDSILVVPIRFRLISE